MCLFKKQSCPADLLIRPAQRAGRANVSHNKKNGRHKNKVKKKGEFDESQR